MSKDDLSFEWAEVETETETESPLVVAEHVPTELHSALALIADLADDASVDELEGIALAHGADLAALLDLLQTPEGQRLANAARVKGVQTGELIQTKARRALNTGIDRIQHALRDESASAATVGKLVEILNRLSGLTEERAARLKVSADASGFMSLHIRGPNDPEPPPAVPGEMRLSILWAEPSAKKVPGTGIDAEVVDG